MSADYGMVHLLESAPLALRRLGRLAVIATVPVIFGACEWFSDFKEQPKLESWESYGFANSGRDSMLTDTIPMRGQPEGSIPISGVSVPVWQVSYARLPATIDSVAELVSNPIPMSQESLDRGRMHYQINCATCHGDTGAGDGRSTYFGMIPFPIVTASTQSRSDGYIWALMRNGRGLMPNYNRIDEMDRWDVVNYVRGLQGMAGGLTVETGPLGEPGEGGDLVPRGTEIAPTRPAPHRSPSTWLQPQAAAPIQGGASASEGQSADTGSNS